MRGTKVLEVLIPPDALVHFQEEAHDLSDVRVVILRQADFTSNILVVGQAHLYTEKKVNESD